MITIEELAKLGQKYNLDIGLVVGYPDFVFLRKYDDEIRYGATMIVSSKEFTEDPKAVLKSYSEFLDRKMYDARLNELKAIDKET